MQALLCQEFGPIDRLVLETVDDPVPAAGEVLIGVRAAGINFPDLLIVQGKYQARPPLPFVPGGECAGVVEAVGAGVERARVGDPVIAMGLTGAFAEKMTAPEASTIPIPEGMSFEAAAGVAITYGTSYYALEQRARLREEETLLVLGAGGGVGLAAVELGRAMGARVIAAAGSEEKLAAAAAAGAELGFDYTSEPIKEKVKALTEGRGVDVVCDPVGGDYSEQALRAMAWGGRFLVIGFASGEIPAIPLNLALLKGVAILGVFWGSWLERDPAASRRSFAELQRMFEEGRLQPKVTTYPLASYAEALAALAARRAVGKLVLVMDRR